jgi:DNA-directed RNA polymerase II subunit RPB7
MSPSSHSYIIAITNLINMSNLRSGSKVIHGTGEAEFTLHYQALVMKPIKGEVVDCSVEKVGKLGFFCLLGPMQIFVSTHVSSAVFFFWVVCRPSSSGPPHTHTRSSDHILAISGCTRGQNDDKKA